MEEKMEDLMVEAEAIEVEAEEAIQEAEIVAEEAQVFYDEQIYINLCMIKEGNFLKSWSLILPLEYRNKNILKSYGSTRQ
jgi:hypothetical protein